MQRALAPHGRITQPTRPTRARPRTILARGARRVPALARVYMTRINRAEAARPAAGRRARALHTAAELQPKRHTRVHPRNVLARGARGVYITRINRAEAARPAAG